MTFSVYYVVAGAGNSQPICPTDLSRSRLCASIAHADRKSIENGLCVKVLAYCLDTLCIRMALEVPNARGVRRFLHVVFDGYETGKGRELGGGSATSLFVSMQSVRLGAKEDILSTLRHCHLAPVQLGLVKQPEDWRWSTHRSYLGLDRTPGLHRSLITYLLAGGPGGWPLAYRYLMSEVSPGESMLRLPTLDVAALPNAEPDGDPTCLQALRANPRERARERIFNAVVVEVCDTTGCDPDEFMSDPSDRRFRLERALLLEEFTVRRRGLINVHQLALRLHSDRSWLYRTRAECRIRYPEFFIHRKKPGS
jgi:hypothetical protein